MTVSKRAAATLLLAAALTPALSACGPSATPTASPATVTAPCPPGGTSTVPGIPVGDGPSPATVTHVVCPPPAPNDVLRPYGALTDTDDLTAVADALSVRESVQAQRRACIELRWAAEDKGVTPDTARCDGYAEKAAREAKAGVDKAVADATAAGKPVLARALTRAWIEGAK